MRDDSDQAAPEPGHPDFIHPSEKRVSDLMEQAVAGAAERVSVGDLVRRMSARGLAPLVMLVAILNIVTIIPGSSTVMGLPS